MRITPRSEEVSAVKAILESDDYADADQMAKAIVKACADAFWMREWLALVHRDASGTSQLNWGPFSAEAEAISVANAAGLGGLGGRFGLVRLSSPGQLIANAVGKKGWKGFCADPVCGHAPFMHSSVGTGRGKCTLSICDCKAFKK